MAVADVTAVVDGLAVRAASLAPDFPELGELFSSMSLVGLNCLLFSVWLFLRTRWRALNVCYGRT